MSHGSSRRDQGSDQLMLKVLKRMGERLPRTSRPSAEPSVKAGSWARSIHRHVSGSTIATWREPISFYCWAQS